ncbi:MAG: MarR family transcriptional regulator [Prochloraceae cyanobacterium]|nr:MarR family transcriptional regulator [Prochloraceae cyanobacterium]
MWFTLTPDSDSFTCSLGNFDRPLKEIATELGFTPQTLSKALKKLEQEGRITRQDKKQQCDR